ncbi:hypothetical protein [Sphingobium yanoikuyae]|uniref:Tail fiber assembly protein n=1 Tax=Sphingobium yanoikuyae TaxID=13690 RepID=A0A430BB89_SPHYA|nr:hypothetical protein [Sphingobium yanoikuyae]RSU45815.1 hypothetical protein DAH51_27000 [Sphingobium yanoikuyae]
MDIFFSPGACAFFTPALHGDAVPADAVAITADAHRALIDGQSQGRAIIADDDGHPCLAPVVQPTLAQLRAQAIARTKREAARRIEAVAPLWRQMNDIRDRDAGTATYAEAQAAAIRFAVIDAIRAASNAIEADIATATAKTLKAIDLAAHPLWPVE